MYQNSYSIDDIVRYSSNKQYSNNLNYHISQSESCVHPTADNPQEYHGQQQKPLIYSGNHHYTDDKTTTYYFTPQFFLKPSRRQTQFINTTEQVQALIEETFKTLTFSLSKLIASSRFFSLSPRFPPTPIKTLVIYLVISTSV